MRCTQFIGLSPEARQYLDEHVAYHKPTICKECGQPLPGQKTGMVYEVYDEETGKRAGMFDDGPPLCEYTMKDGSKVREIVQAVPWSSGPMIFLCLEDDKGDCIGAWSEKEIDGA